MNYPVVDHPPKNIGEYVTAKPNDIPDDYINNLADLLKQCAFHIKTDAVQIGWVLDAIKKAQVDCYKITIQRVSVNFGEAGTAHAIFYFERNPNSN